MPAYESQCLNCGSCESATCPTCQVCGGKHIRVSMYPELGEVADTVRSYLDGRPSNLIDACQQVMAEHDYTDSEAAMELSRQLANGEIACEPTASLGITLCLMKRDLIAHRVMMGYQDGRFSE